MKNELFEQIDRIDQMKTELKGCSLTMSLYADKFDRDLGSGDDFRFLSIAIERIARDLDGVVTSLVDCTKKI